MPSFYEKLTESIQTNNSLLCLGLDPDSMQYPEAFPNGHREISSVDWGTKLIEATADLVCCYKPNIAFYEQSTGLIALQKTLNAVSASIPILLDANGLILVRLRWLMLVQFLRY